MEAANIRGRWVEFTTETGFIGFYQFDSSIDDDFKNQFRIKVKTKLVKGYYYSAVNEVGSYFDEVILPDLINRELPSDKIIISFNDYGNVTHFDNDLKKT